MKSFILISIDSDFKPLMNINRIIVTQSAEKAALEFMASAFSGSDGIILAKLKIQNESGHTKTFDVRRMPIVKNKNKVYKHFVV